MDISVNLRARQWPGIRTRVVIIVIIFMIAARWAPGQVLPLGLGGWLAATAPRPHAGPALRGA